MNLGILVIAVLLFGAVALICFHLETKFFTVKKYTIASGNLPEAFRNTKLALITDLHSTEYGKGNKRLLAAIEREQPDYILIAGDMLVGKEKEDFTPALKLLEAIADRYPVYYSYGNHECRLKEYRKRYGSMAGDYERALKKLPVHMLHNKGIELKRGDASIHIYGLEIAYEYYTRFKTYKMTGKYLTKLLGEKKNGYGILIAHNPFYFPAYAEWGADLVVSGHNHGGIVKVPFFGGLVDPNLRLFPKYDKGLFREKESQMVLSGGMGSHSPHFRAWNLPELVMITLTGKESVE